MGGRGPRHCILTGLVSLAVHRDSHLVPEGNVLSVLWAERRAPLALHGYPCHSLSSLMFLRSVPETEMPVGPVTWPERITFLEGPGLQAFKEDRNRGCLRKHPRLILS